MHRDLVDNAVIYSADDLVLFRESPFACWMERLTLENPAHGIAPDPGAEAPGAFYQSQRAFAATLRSSGRECVQVDWNLGEHQRYRATKDAMRDGADFILDGHLAVGPLAGPVNLLLRTQGASELGDYLYLPCDTQGDRSVHGPFRLCFLADLLYSVQGQLPGQLVVARRDSELTILPTEEHIHYYRAVKQRFLLAQRDFHGDRMPDPAESSHYGRWHRHANEVIRRGWRLEPEGPPQPRGSQPREPQPREPQPSPQLSTQPSDNPVPQAAPHPLDSPGFSITGFSAAVGESGNRGAAPEEEMPSSQKSPPFDDRLNTSEWFDD